MRISLQSFMRTGVLGEIRIGMTPAEVLELTGAPERGDITLQDERRSAWTFGDIWIGFNVFAKEPRVCNSIEWIPDAPEISVPTRFELVDWDLRADVAIDEVLTMLNLQGIRFRRDSFPSSLCERIVLSSGLQIVFMNERLNSFGIFKFDSSVTVPNV